MNNFWKNHYDQNVEIFKDSLYKQVGKTVNGVPVDSGQLNIITSNIIDKLALNHDDVLVDMCCGNGLITKSLAPNVKKVIGVDFSQGLIDTAISTSHAGNITYMASDALQLTRDFFIEGSKLCMYEALQFFSIDMLEKLLKNMSYIRSGTIFFIGSVPDKDKLWNYYDTEEKKQFYLRSEAENKPHMGNWWGKSGLELVAAKNGYKATFLNQNSELYTSYYRFDCLLEKTDG